MEAVKTDFKAMELNELNAIRSLLQQIVNVSRMRFDPTASHPNAETEAAMQDTRSGQNLSAYENFDDLMSDLHD